MNTQRNMERGARRRIILASNTSWYLDNFRGEMMRRLVERGWEVYATAPDDEYRRELEKLGVRFELWPLSRRSLAPVANALAFLRILRLYRRLRPDIVHHFTIKPVILGGIAARLTRVPAIVQSVTGLGHAFSGPAPLRMIALTLYRLALGGRALTIFQNVDDMQTILAAGVTVRARCRLIRGSGIDTQRFGSIPPPSRERPVTFLMASRMLWAKGVREFVEAASIVHGREPDTRFLLVGDPDEGSPDAIPHEWLEALSESSPVEWRPFAKEIEPTLAEAHVVVLPSYREGLSRSLLEGAAAGRPLIATDAPGCREIAVDGVTGRTVPVGDTEALAEAMNAFAADYEHVRVMGARGRELVTGSFSLDRVIDDTVTAYEDALASDATDGNAQRSGAAGGSRGPLRIMHIITGLGTGGAEQMLARLLEYGDRERFQPVIVSLGRGGDIGGRIRALEVPVYELGMKPGRPSVTALLHLRGIIRREAPHVIQTWMYHADLLGGVAAKLAGGVPVAWGIRHTDLDPTRTKSTTLRVVRLCARLSRALPTAIVTNSEAALSVHGELGYDVERMAVIPNGFDLSVYRPDPERRAWLRGELGIPEDAVVIASAGRYHPVKNQVGLLAAAALLEPARRAGPPLHFVLCGKDVTPANGDLADAAAVEPLAGHVHLLGRRDDLHRVFAGSDIFASASLGEAFPQVVGEAMSCGTPCAVTDVGDSAMIVGDTGAVVPPGDPAALAEACRRLIELGDEGRSSLGARARERIRERFEIGHVVGRFEELHAALAARTRR